MALKMKDEALLQEAARIHSEAIVLDSHSDTTAKLDNPDWDFSEYHEEGHMDLPRLKQGGVDAQFLAVYMGQVEGEGRAIKEAIDSIDRVYSMIECNSGELVLAQDVKQIREAWKANKIAILLGIEGGHIIEDDLHALRTFRRLGVRYLTLTHCFHTNWADSSGIFEDLEPKNNGLSDFGKEVILEMNRLGVIPDISHASDKAFWDTVETSELPVVATHSGCRALANHRRNLTDEMIHAIAEKEGVVQIVLYPAFIDQKVIDGERNLDQSPMQNAIDHIDHVINLVGSDYVGIGGDWDGVEMLPQGLEDCSKFPSITVELLRRGHSENTIKKILGKNFLRVLEETDKMCQKN